MTARAKRVWWIAVAGLLVSGGTTLFFSHSHAVDGLSGKDIAQIRNLVRHEVWRYPLSTWSLADVRYMPSRLWRVCKTRIDQPTQWQNMSGQATWTNSQFGHFPDDVWMVSTSGGEVFLVQKLKGRWHVI